MNKKDHLVQLVAALVTNGNWGTQYEKVAVVATELLIAIEKVNEEGTCVHCGQYDGPKGSVHPDKVKELVEQARAEEREQCAQIADELFYNRRHGDEIAATIRQNAKVFLSDPNLGPQVFTPKHHASCKDQACNRSCMSGAIDKAVDEAIYQNNEENEQHFQVFRREIKCLQDINESTLKALRVAKTTLLLFVDDDHDEEETDVLETIQRAIRLCETSPSMPEKVEKP